MLKVLILASQLQISPSVTLFCLPECVMPQATERMYLEYRESNSPEKPKKKNLERKSFKKKEKKSFKVWDLRLKRSQS